MSQHILVAGCRDETQDILCELFDRAGMSVKCASTVSGAVKLLDETPQLTVIDLAIEGATGIEVVKAIRTRIRPMKLAVVTSGNDTAEFGWIPRYRPDAIFGKPFDLGEFVSWLREFHADHAYPRLLEAFDRQLIKLPRAA